MHIKKLSAGVAVSLTLAAGSTFATQSAAHAAAASAGDGSGDRFTIADTSVNINGNRCATVAYQVNATAAYNTVIYDGQWHGTVWRNTTKIDRHGGYTLGDDGDGNFLEHDAPRRWTGTDKLCAHKSAILTYTAAFDGYDLNDTDCDYLSDGWVYCWPTGADYTAMEEVGGRATIRVTQHYHPVTMTAARSSKNIRIRVLRDGKGWSGISVKPDHVTARRTNARGYVSFPKRYFARHHSVKFSAGGRLAPYATKRLKF